MMFTLTSCDRRDLTYMNISTVEILLNVDWSDMSEAPTGMSIYCYPDNGGSPTVKILNLSAAEQAAMYSSTTLKLGAGSYKILIFNQTPSELSSTIGFSGMDSYETAEVYAMTTTSKWYTSKSEETLVESPDELAAATDHSVEIPESAIDEIYGLTQQYYDTGIEVGYYMTVEVAPKVVIRTTRVTIEIDQIDSYSDARSTLYGMATGYNFSTQKSHSSYVTHLLESWSKTVYEGDGTQGAIVAYFTCFGLPETTTATRVVDSSWGGTLHLEVLLTSGEIYESDHTLYDKTTIYADEATNRSEDEEDEDVVYDDSDVDISVDISGEVSLPEIESSESSGTTGGFSPGVSDWEDEEIVDIPL